MSRGSTASIHSLNPQHNLDQTAFAETPDMFAAQWLGDGGHGHPKDMGGAGQMPHEVMMLQAATSMQTPGQEFAMDGSMGAAMGHHMQFQPKHPMARHPLPEQFAPNASFTEGSSQLMDRDDNDEGDSAMVVTMAAPPKPTSTRSSANNELEMRQLFSANRDRTLQDVATELHGNERGPNSERTRQVFAMLWINSVCSKGKGSVPRGRVYANYASRCATERITVLNPASFGKLVRVLFPGLKTRRLGVRGESKYHYVNFNLVDDQPDIREPSQPPKPLTESGSFCQDFNTAPSQSSTNLGQDSLQPPQLGINTKNISSSAKSARSSHSRYNLSEMASIDHVRTTTTKTVVELGLPSEFDYSMEKSQVILLPNVDMYLPDGTDPDAAKSLTALYRSHCTSLVECIRYCREKTFFHLYTSFQGTMTMPVQKLFGNPVLAPWIEQCDFVLYQRMMDIVSALTLQVLPKAVMEMLKAISERLIPHIRESFQGQPQHVIRAKEAPATLFASLLHRVLKVNLTAHAAANMLYNPANRDQMYVDWITLIKPRKIAECIPTRGMDDLVDLMLSEIRNLVNPASVPWEVECLTIYGDMATANGRSQWMGEDKQDKPEANVLEQWVTFLRGIPAKFPYASPADLVWCMERVGTAVMREITMSQGKSFGTWWVTKMWVDEMFSFMAEQAGFMKQRNSQSAEAFSSPQPLPSTTETNRQTSRFNGANEDLDLSNMPDAQAGRAPFPPSNRSSQNTMGMSGGDLHDDSGIGIRTPEEDFPMDKFGFVEPDSQDQSLMTNAEI